MTEWAAYYRLEPFGEMVADQRHGIQTALLANVNRDSKRRPDAFTSNEFIPWHPSHREHADDMLLDDPEAHSRLLKESLFKFKG